MAGHVILSHGFGSDPEAHKTTACGKVAEALGWTAERPDYRAFDACADRSRLGDVEARVAHLLGVAKRCDGPLVLAGSSLGAYVSARVSLEVPVVGLFLMAPPVWLEDYDAALRGAKVPTWVVHGWNDELIPAAWVASWGQATQARTTFVPDGHRLDAHVDFCAQEFGRFLQALP
jgi:predicted alpha/beta-hydrolase family hydrolase